MNTTSTFRTVTARALLFSAFVLLISLLAMSSGCRHKVGPTGPSDSTVGHWALLVRGPAILYRNAVGGYVPNFDSITVRAYDPNGALHGGILVHSQCETSLDSITFNVTTQTDTAVNWRGCEPFLTYWGSGGAEGHDAINSYFVADTDTVRATYYFEVRNP